MSFVMFRPSARTCGGLLFGFLTLLLACPVTYAADPDAVTILPLDDGGGSIAADVSGMGNDGTLVNGPSYEASTGDGSAFAVRFDGSDDRIDLGTLDVNGGGLTLAAWFNADGFPGPSNDPRLISKASGVQGNQHVFMLSTINASGAIRLRARVRVGGSTTTLVASSGDIFAGAWRHAALTYDGATLRLFLDAVEVGSTPLSGAVDTDPSMHVAIGSQPVGIATNFFDGLLDDVRILQRALAPSEIIAIVNGTNENQPPVAVDDNYQTDPDTPLIVEIANGILANDVDPDLDPLRAALGGDVSNGTLALNEDGSFSYAPDLGFNGTDVFTYRAHDETTPDPKRPIDRDPFEDFTLANGLDDEPNQSPSNLATVTITVDLPVNNAPVAVNDNYQTQLNTAIVVNALNGVLQNDTDTEQDPLQAFLVDDVSSGVLNLNLDGSFDYTPNLDFTGPDNFTYHANDGLQNSNLGSVTINVTGGGADPDAIVVLGMDEGSGTLAGDTSGMGNDGTLINGAAFDANTGDGSSSSVRFDGVDDLIDLGTIDVNGSGLTVACWFNADFPDVATDPRLISKASSTGNHIFMIGTTDGPSGTIRLRGRVRIGGFQTTLEANSGGLATNEWRHAALTYDGATLRLYLDAVEVASTSLSGAIDTDPFMSVAVGGQPPGAGGRNFDGLIDDVRILQRALSANELLAIVGGPSPPVIDVWYGDVQDFGVQGNPQTLIQVLGRARETVPLTSLSYRFNGGTSQPLTIGPDGLRLVGLGDFVVEIDNTSLNVGSNTVEITAMDVLGQQTVRTVTVNYTSGATWPLPATLTWQGASDLTDVAQPVDGWWYLEGSGVRTVPHSIGWDRVLAAGEHAWVPNYEALATMTIHEIRAIGSAGFGVGWQGHSGSGQPAVGHPFQAIGWITQNGTVQMLRDGDDIQAQTQKSLVLGVPYKLKVRSQTVGGGMSNVRVKWWAASGSEPGGWDLDETLVTRNGSVILVAHHTDVTYGEVTITPLSGSAAALEPIWAGTSDSPPTIPELTVKQNFPNPFVLSTEIEYGLPESGDATLQIFDVRGKRVFEQLLSGQTRGLHRFRFDGRTPAGRPLAGGVYFYKIVTPQGAVGKKLLIVR